MKKFLPILASLLFVIHSGYSQKALNLGFSSGIVQYFGDLGNDEFMQGSSVRPGMALTIRNFISPSPVSGMQYSPLNVEARITWHRIGYDETRAIGDKSGRELRNYGRGLAFRNDIFGAATHISYTYYPNRRLPLHKQSVALFVYAGVGVYYGKPKADLFNGDVNINNRYYYWSDGTVRDGAESSGMGNIIEKDGEYETDLTQWNTEGQGYGDEMKPKSKMYNDFNVGIPMGFGFRYGINKALTFSLEFSYYKFMTDYLDDVSNAYATRRQIEQQFPNDPVKQALAEYISDPTGLGTNGYVGPQTSRRGNPELNDSYSYISMEIAYKFNWHPEKLTALFAKR